MDELFYNTGTVTLTNGDATVEGSGTLWQVDADHPRIIEGDELVALDASDDVPYRILSVTDDNTLELSRPWQGTTQSGRAYIIYKTSPFRNETPRLLDWVRDLIDSIGTLDDVLTATSVANAVNHWAITDAITGGVPKISVTGSDTNISARYATKGTGEHIWEVNGVDELRLSGTSLYPHSDGGLALGGPSNKFSAGIFTTSVQVLGTTAARLILRTTGSNNPEIAVYDTTDGGFTWFNQDGTAYLGRLNASGTWTKNLISVTTNDTVAILGTGASTSTTTGCATFGGGIGVAGAGNFGGAVSAVSFALSAGTALQASGNFTRLRNALNGGSLIDLGGTGEDYLALKTDGVIAFHNLADAVAMGVATTGTGGVVVGAPTGSYRGTGTINAVGVYDDSVLLTCFGIEYLIDGKIDVAKWDGFAPRGRHQLVHRFVDMLGGEFDPRDHTSYIAKMYRDRALPGMPTQEDWQHNSLSMGEMTNRLWLAAELQASAFKSHVDKTEGMAAQIESLAAELSVAQHRIDRLESITRH